LVAVSSRLRISSLLSHRLGDGNWAWLVFEISARKAHRISMKMLILEPALPNACPSRKYQTAQRHSPCILTPLIALALRQSALLFVGGYSVKTIMACKYDQSYSQIDSDKA
jgi:hypothetical protein